MVGGDHSRGSMMPIIRLHEGRKGSCPESLPRSERPSLLLPPSGVGAGPKRVGESFWDTPRTRKNALFTHLAPPASPPYGRATQRCHRAEGDVYGLCGFCGFCGRLFSGWGFWGSKTLTGNPQNPQKPHEGRGGKSRSLPSAGSGSSTTPPSPACGGLGSARDDRVERCWAQWQGPLG